MRLKRWIALLLALLLLFSLTACNGGTTTPGGTPDETPGETPEPTPNPDPDPNPDPEPEPEVPTISITASSPYAAVGNMLEFTVDGTGFDREALTFTATAGMTNTPQKTEQGCKMRVTKEGELTVTATSGELSATCKVTVFPESATVGVDDENIYYLGRHEKSGDKILLNNTGAGFEITFYGKTLSARMGNLGGEAIFAVMLDGEKDPEACKINLTTDTKSGKVILATFDAPGLHTVRVQKITEEQISRASFSGLFIEKGGILPHQPTYSMKLEVYGDSITAGFGNMREIGAADDQKQQNGLLTYAAITASRLNAEYRAFCQSGIGLYTNPYGNTRWMKDVYSNASPASDTRYDMTAYTPDIVLINIGTNDIWAGNGSAGNAPFSAAAYQENYVKFVKDLHAVYGDSTTFILCSGMMETGLASSVTAAMNTLHGDGILNVYNVVLPQSYGGHPHREVHEAAAKVLLQEISTIMGIDIPAE